MATHTRTHVLVGFDNPYLVCNKCKNKVPYWHNPERCGCDDEGFYNSPCGHTDGVSSKCFSWNPVDGCMCTDSNTHDQ